jgi:riboflavin kinase
MLGFIRPEYNYASLESLIDDIKEDCEVAKRSLDREAYTKLKDDSWLHNFSWAANTDVEKIEKEILGQS